MTIELEDEPVENNARAGPLDEPPRGRIVDPDGDSKAFVGYVDLIGQIEAARERQRRRFEKPPPDGPAPEAPEARSEL